MTSFVVKVLVLLLTGLLLGVGINIWPVVDDVPRGVAGDFVARGLDPLSYGIGLFVGMILWQICSVPWGKLPANLQKFFAAQMPFYRFLVVSAACVLVLWYF